MAQDRRLPDPRVSDLDTDQVLKTLEGANRAAGDPDVALIAMLPGMEGTDDPVDWIRALERLVRDANPD